MGVYSLPDLPYDYSALEPHYSAEVLELHHAKHHAAYVKGVNDAIEALAAVRDSDDFAQLTMLEKNLAFHLSGHVLHSVFWTNLTPEGGGEPDGDLGDAISEHFGSFDRMRQHLDGRDCHGARSRVGRTRVGADRSTARRRAGLRPPGQHRPGCDPTPGHRLVEHAYYLQYRNLKADYVEAMWNLVNWGDVDRRFDVARASPITLYVSRVHRPASRLLSANPHRLADRAHGCEDPGPRGWTPRPPAYPAPSERTATPPLERALRVA